MVMKTEIVRFRLANEELEALDAVVDRAGTTRSKLLRAATQALVTQAVRDQPGAENQEVASPVTAPKSGATNFHLVLSNSLAERVRDQANAALQSTSAWITGALKRITGEGVSYFPADLQALSIARATLLDTARHLRDLNLENAVDSKNLADLRSSIADYTRLLTKIMRESRQNPLD
jgi:hypothetical protein